MLKWKVYHDVKVRDYRPVIKLILYWHEILSYNIINSKVDYYYINHAGSRLASLGDF